MTDTDAIRKGLLQNDGSCLSTEATFALLDEIDRLRAELARWKEHHGYGRC
jgi:uncharacterized small protein (DUF1192 family)